MKILVVLLSLGCTGAAYADVGPIQGGSTVGDSGTASVAPTWNPDVSHGVIDPTPGASTFIPSGSTLLDPSQARDGVDSLGGFDGTQPTPGVLGGDTEFPANPTELQVPGRNSMPSNGGHF